MGDGPAPAAAALAPPQERAERQRKQQLRQLGYAIDERLYRPPLAELRKLAAAGNVQALTHLAERYLFELDGKPQRPDFEPGTRYREEARAALQQAYQLGNRHAAAMISESYLLEKQPLEAAAWNLVARRAGDALSADWFLTTRTTGSWTPGRKPRRRCAPSRSGAICSRARARPKASGGKPAAPRGPAGFLFS